MKYLEKLLKQLEEWFSKNRLRQVLMLLISVFLLPSTANAITFGSLVPEVDFKTLDSITFNDVLATSPKVRLYGGAGCDACNKLKSQLSCVPQIDFVEEEPLSWVTSIPVLHWQGDNGEWYQMGNDGDGVDLQSFVSEYNRTNPSQVTVAFDVLEAKDIDYPIRGNYWSVGSTWNPSRSQVLYHLKYASQHAGKFKHSWLDSRSFKQLQSLHSDDHEYRVRWASVEKKTTAPKPQSTQKRAYAQSYSKPRNRFLRRRSRSRGCPSGNCPL